MDTDLAVMLGDIQKSLGRIEQKVDGAGTNLKDHIDHDEKVTKAVFERIEALQTSQAKQKGYIAGMVTAGSALGGVLGWLGELWIKGR